MSLVSALTRKRWQAFWRVRRSRWALLCITSMFLLSLPAEFLANSKPLIISYQGQLYFPILQNYQGTDFGQDSIVPPDYKAIRAQIEAEGWMITAPVFWGSNETNPQPDIYPGPPSAENWLGTDDRGRDVFVRLLYGFRLSMLMAVFALLVAALLGVMVGGVQGFMGGKIDLIGQRVVEIWTSLPSLFILILVAHLFEPTAPMLMVCLASFIWMPAQYYIRAECLKVKGLDFVKVAESLGASKMRIFWVHVLPNSLNPLITLAPFIMNASIIILSSLDYLGLGVQAPTASLGELLRQGKEHILHSWWLTFYPLSVLTLSLLMLNFVGDGIRAAFDPRSYST